MLERITAKLSSYLGWKIQLTLFVAIITQLVIHFFPSLFWAGPENKAFDLAVKLYADTATTGNYGHRIAFIDIDESTYEKLGNPVVTPNAVIADLITSMMNTKASIIVVDIDVAFSIGGSDSQALLDVLKTYPQEDAPLLLLVRENDLRYSEIMETRYDAIVQHNKLIKWVNAIIQPDSDGVVRNYISYQGCDNDHQSLPSAVEVVFNAIYSNQTTNSSPQLLENCLNQDAKHRFLYSFNYDNTKRTRASTLIHGQSSPVFTRTIANHLLHNKSISTAKFNHSIVIIGNSHQFARDSHMSPLGNMPGAIILANAIYSKLSYGDIKEFTLFGKLAIVIALTILSLTIFNWFKWLSNKYRDRLYLLTPTLPIMVVGSFIFLIWLYITPIALYQYGIWLNIFVSQAIVTIFLEIMEVRMLARELVKYRNRAKQPL